MNDLIAIRNAIMESRKKEMAWEKSNFKVFELLEKVGADLDRDSKAENADNLGDAVSCFIQYGEYNIYDLMKEIEAALPESIVKGDEVS